MHEMSIIVNVLNIARDAARADGAAEIVAIEMEVGRLAGVDVAALEFCFAAARTQTIGEQAELVIKEIPGRGRCAECGAEQDIDLFWAVCDRCGRGTTRVLQGGELRVKSISVK